MSFDEAMTRARAAHVIVSTFRQPGNGYRTEHECKCRAFVYADNWDAHVVAAADALREGREFIPAAGMTVRDDRRDAKRQSMVLMVLGIVALYGTVALGAYMAPAKTPVFTPVLEGLLDLTIGVLGGLTLALFGAALSRWPVT